jgi:hypothetical protein
MPSTTRINSRRSLTATRAAEIKRKRLKPTTTETWTSTEKRFQ